MPHSLFFAHDTRTRDALQRRYEKKELFRIRRGIYADTADEQLQHMLLLDQWAKVAAYLYPSAVAVYRTAAELRPVEGRVYLMVDEGTRRQVQIGPLVLSLEPGVIDQGVEPFSMDLQCSTLPRQLLENLTVARERQGIRKALGAEWVEYQLMQDLRRRGEAGLNQLRDEAARLAPVLGLEEEQRRLYEMVAAILATHPSHGILQTRAGNAQAAGEPFDAERVELFQRFAEYLSKLDLAPVPYVYDTAGWRTLTFFESYFSNYIEGTRFTIDEAETIYVTGHAQYERHEDSHDILALIEIAGDQTEMARVPESAVELIDILQVRHGVLLAKRSDKRPGEFKQKPNEAGGTQFVQPELMLGTLSQGFSIYAKLPAGILRALFMHFFVAEVHPFDDGNGRLARVMLNAELVAADQHKIIVPSVCRDNYLSGLRQASRSHRFRTLVKVLHQLQQYTASIDWMVRENAREELLNDAADKEPDQGLMIFNKALRQFTGDYKPD